MCSMPVSKLPLHEVDKIKSGDVDTIWHSCSSTCFHTAPSCGCNTLAWGYCLFYLPKQSMYTPDHFKQLWTVIWSIDQFPSKWPRTNIRMQSIRLNLASNNARDYACVRDHTNELTTLRVARPRTTVQNCLRSPESKGIKRTGIIDTRVSFAGTSVMQD